MALQEKVLSSSDEKSEGMEVLGYTTIRMKSKQPAARPLTAKPFVSANFDTECMMCEEKVRTSTSTTLL